MQYEEQRKFAQETLSKLMKYTQDDITNDVKLKLEPLLQLLATWFLADIASSLGNIQTDLDHIKQ